MRYPFTVSTYWIAVDSDERLSIAAGMRGAIAEWSGLGLERIQAVCNRRRLWLVENVDSPYVQAGGVGRDLVLEELGPEFRLKELDERLVVEFRHNRFERDRRCPMICESGVISVYSAAFDVQNRLVAPTAIGLSVRQLTFHELLHAHGDTVYDGLVRPNWAGVGAIVREIAGQPVDAADDKPLVG